MNTAPVRALQSLRRRGLGETLDIAVRESKREAVKRARLKAEQRFDRRLGVETAGVRLLDDLDDGATQWDDARMYEPIPVPVLDGILRALPIAPGAFTLLDLGCGKGRAPLLAADLGFGHAVGVELSPALTDIALRNAAAYREQFPAADVRFVCGDAGEYPMPGGPLVLFLYDPFGEDTVRRVAANLAASLDEDPREAYVAYVAPHYRAAFDELDALRELDSGDRWVAWTTA